MIDIPSNITTKQEESLSEISSDLEHHIEHNELEQHIEDHELSVSSEIIEDHGFEKNQIEDSGVEGRRDRGESYTDVHTPEDTRVRGESYTDVHSPEDTRVREVSHTLVQHPDEDKARGVSYTLIQHPEESANQQINIEGAQMAAEEVKTTHTKPESSEIKKSRKKKEKKNPDVIDVKPLEGEKIDGINTEDGEIAVELTEEEFTTMMWINLLIQNLLIFMVVLPFILLFTFPCWIGFTKLGQ